MSTAKNNKTMWLTATSNTPTLPQPNLLRRQCQNKHTSPAAPSSLPTFSQSSFHFIEKSKTKFGRFYWFQLVSFTNRDLTGMTTGIGKQEKQMTYRQYPWIKYFLRKTGMENNNKKTARETERDRERQRDIEIIFRSVGTRNDGGRGNRERGYQRDCITTIIRRRILHEIAVATMCTNCSPATQISLGKEETKRQIEQRQLSRFTATLRGNK